MEHKCDQCALKALQGGMCPIFRADMSGKNGCPYFQTDLHTCSICGSPIIGTIYFEHDDNMNWHEECINCIQATPCQTCIHSYCAFQQDTNCQEPPMVMRQMQQGNMIVQQQVMNPKRVEATCRKSCPCFNEEGLDDGSFCTRQFGCGCSKYHTNWRN